MDQARLERLLTELYATDGSTSVLHRICVVCRHQTSVDGAGLTRLDNGVHELVIASDDHAAVVELLQIDLGEGPSIDTLRSFRRSHHADLTSAEAPRAVAKVCRRCDTERGGGRVRDATSRGRGGDRLARDVQQPDR